MSEAAAEAERAESFLRYPMIVKPAAQGSSIGIRAAADREELIDAMAVAAEFDDKLLVEEKLTDFAEVNCAAYGRGGKVVVSQTVYVNEVNTVPGSLAFYLFEPLGVSFSQLISDQIEEALERKRKGGKRKVYRTPVLELYGRGAKGAKRGK